ncbi:dihydrodipicolinate synthase family protein [Actinocatenispora rupis]|uniref:Dihydrodipicolinate synthetase n=1 Tax=Actinocatenispora rupis TaxID=519421 RepID=A0A8J3J610_9ACTN|nr:dihydrodipicolinate synthase family protein [Actinocatenispora rupis]GID10827.1 dihydrodipicolinate synthetase [Actinocatenispora rupis]
MLTDDKRARLREGLVIPAHPLALTADRALDEPRQRALTRYYTDAGVGGLAVGVHTTQFEIRAHGLYEPVLRMAAEEAGPDPVLVAGVLGPTENAVAEAKIAADLGYDLALVATPGWGDAPDDEILAGVAAVAEIMPVFGFYIQPTIGKRRFGYEFWRGYAEIPGVAAIKVAPFDRYATLDVVRAVVEAGRSDDIALYTGNDDNIVADLVTPYRFGERTVHIVGGLLGQWAVWTPAAVALHAEVRDAVRSGGPVPLDLLARGAELTDANAAVFDVAHRFTGSIAGVNEVLTRDGLLAGNWCLSDHERLSPGQADEISRVIRDHPAVTAVPAPRTGNA